MFTRLTCSVLLRVQVLGAELGLKLNVLFRSREEDLVLFQCCRLNPNFRLERSGADIQTSSQEISFQLCIPIWLEGFSAVYFMMMIFFFFALPLLAAVICLKSPFSDQFPRLNLWGARRLYVRLERGVKLFSRQCDGVSRRCFSAKQKINIYWQDSEGFFFLSVFLFGRICVHFACKDTRHTVCFFGSNQESEGSSSLLVVVFFGFICQWELGCEPLTHMGDKTNGPGFGSNASDSQFTLWIATKRSDGPSARKRRRPKERQRWWNNLQLTPPHISSL